MTTPAGGTGTGVNITPVPPNVINFETAEADNAKRALFMVSDSLKSADFSFIEHRPYRYDNQNPSRPKISHPTHQLRTGTDRQVEDTSWVDRYDALVDDLPDDVKTWFKEQQELSYFIRDPLYFSFNTNLVLTAKTLAWYDRVAISLAEDIAIIEKAKDNLMFPFAATQAAITLGKETLTYTQDHLSTIGANDPNYDKLLGYYNQLLEALNTFENTVDNLAQERPGAYEELLALTNDLDKLKTQFQSTTIGKELTLLGPLIDTLAHTTSALTIGYGPASVHWILILSKTDNSELQKTLSELASGLLQNTHISQKAFLNSSLEALLTFHTAFALSLVHEGIGTLPKSNPHTEQEIRFLTLDHAFHMLNDTNIFTNTFKALAGAIGADENAKNAIADASTLTLLTLIHLAMDEELSEAFFLSFRPELSELIEKVRAMTPESGPLALYLQQAKLALEKQSNKGFKDAYNQLLETTNISPTKLKSETESIHALGSLIAQNMIAQEKPQTNIQNV